MPDASARDPGKLDWYPVLFALVFPSLVTWAYFVALAGESAGVQQASYSVGKAVQFLFPVVWVFGWCRRPWRWEWPGAGGLALGCVFGAVVVAAMLALYHGFLEPGGYFDGPGEAVRRKLAGLRLNSVARYAALGVFYAIGHSFLEEYYWRWFVFGEMRRLVSPAKAILLSGAGFMAHHVIVLAVYFGWWSPATWIFSCSVAVGGAFWAWLYHDSRSLLGPWASHLLVDAGIFIVGYDLIRGSF